MTFDYDLSGNLVSRGYTHADGTKAYSNTLKYDDKGLKQN